VLVSRTIAICHRHHRWGLRPQPIVKLAVLDH